MSAIGFSRDRLQPALLDRLIDDAPHVGSEAAESKAISRGRLRQIVLRDLSWLLNATSCIGEADDRVFEHAKRSVLNYGMPPLSGKLASKVELFELEQTLRRAIIDFEPRILPGSLSVRGFVPTDPLSQFNVLQFEIVGQLWAHPYPLELLLKTDVDLETGLVEIRDANATLRAERGTAEQ